MPRTRRNSGKVPSSPGGDFRLGAPASAGPTSAALPVARTNPQIAAQLLGLAQLLAAKGENPFKIRAYRRAAETIENLPESVETLVRSDSDLTQFAGIGPGISGVIREIVLEGNASQLERLRSDTSPEIAALCAFPRLDPKRVQRIYQKLKIASVAELESALESGAIAKALGPRLAQHVQHAMKPSTEILLYDADPLAETIREFLRKKCRARHVEVVGELRRRKETVQSLDFLVESADFGATMADFAQFGGGASQEKMSIHRASFRLPAGALVTLGRSDADKRGLALVLATGSVRHLELLDPEGATLPKLARSRSPLKSEEVVYAKLGLQFIEPELREGNDEVACARRRELPKLISLSDLRGDLHTHSTSSDGAHTVEQMADAARARGYAYLGITDHSQSLKIAGGVPEDALWKQIRAIDRMNRRLDGIQILKSAEVDILADGTLDYTNALLAELDYTVCSIHSRFGLNKEQQTERVMRAMDNPHFTFLGHATGRLLLRRAGYELDLPRLIRHARENGCFFEINSSPDRLDLSAENARLVRDAGVKIALCTDAHSIQELDFMRWGLNQARRAGLQSSDVLNTHAWPELQKLFKRA